MKEDQAVGARNPMVMKLNPVLTHHQVMKLAEFNLCQTATAMTFALEIGFEQTTSIRTERDTLVQFSPELSASEKSKNNVKDGTWLNSKEAGMHASARNLMV